MTLAEAVREKFGIDPHGGTGAYRGRAKTVSSMPQYQPWFGFSYKIGRAKYWPAEDVQRWVKVWKHNRDEYARELLSDERAVVREGVEQALRKLRDRGALQQDVLIVLEDHEALVGTRA